MPVTNAAGQSPPGPPQSWLGGSFRDFRRDFLGFSTRCAREYGDIVGFRLGRWECLLINHPDLIESVLVKNAKHVQKHFALRFARGVLGNGLLTSEGNFWLRQRRLAAPAFGAEQIASYGPDMVSACQRMLDTWQDGPRDIHADMMQLALDVVAKTLFGGADVSGESDAVEHALRAALNSFSTRINSRLQIPFWVPTPNNLRVRATVRQLNSVVQHLIDQRRRDERKRKDLLSLLLHARDEDDGTGMSDAQLADEARTFLLAGHETTALSLSWSVYLLATHPEKQAKLVEELDRVLANRPAEVADLPKLKYAEQVVQEAMRLYPPAYVVGRETTDDIELGGYRVPKGTTIFMSQWVMHRDPRYYERPDAFEPERWSSERAATLPKLAYFPFGAGPRICIGNTFAMMESVLLLATIVRGWSLEAASTQKAELAPLITLRPKNGIQIIVRRRGRSAPGAVSTQANAS